ncbi:unnamed protein product [Hymenolepis diminuta]|uniref:SH2 domain-containing protein n=1 Tax=Hymenolepis diminuta TaxID=6216 RepID=A0A3P6XDC1_HYMDI|nr:unnamed protein product [Hymenolepis diminuta]
MSSFRKSFHVSSGLQRHWLDVSGQSDSKINTSNTDSTQSLDANGIESGGARQRALSDPRAPGLSLFFQQAPSTPQTPAQQRNQPPSTPSVRHSVAFFDTPATPRLTLPPSTPLLSATPVLIKDKNRAIFDLPLGSSAASPVVALKTHLDSLANPVGNRMSSSSHHKKSDTAFPHASSSSSSSALASSGPSAVVSRFRLRHSGGSGAAGAKKRQLERPLSQIICQLDSALLLNNSPSFSIQQPRSEERLSVVVNNSNSQSAVAEEVEAGRQQQPCSGFYDEDDVIEGIPRAVVQCLDDLENPPIPPMRVHSLRRGAGEIFGHFPNSSSSETASPHGSRGRRAPLQSLSESSGFEMLDLEHSGGSGSNSHEEATDEDDAEALEFAILEAAVEAEEQAAAAAASGERKKCQLGDVCPVPPLADPVGAWQSPPNENDLQPGNCPLHAGLESSPSPLHNGNGHHGSNHHHQQQFRPTTTTDDDDSSSHWWPSGANGPRSQQISQTPPQSQIDRWTGETPTPTATPTPTPTPANLLPNAHQHLHQHTSQTSPPWFQAYLPREVALELLTHEETGSFLVRDSVTQPGCWALSVRVPAHVNCVGITHYLIQHSKHGVKLKGLDKEWPSLEALITHLTVIPEMLPCPLRLPPTAQYGGSQQPHQASNPTFTEEEENDFNGEPEDEEYQRLSDFSSMLADMQPTTNSTVSNSTAVAPRLFR